VCEANSSIRSYQGFGESLDLIILSDSDALSSNRYEQRDSRSESQ